MEVGTRDLGRCRTGEDILVWLDHGVELAQYSDAFSRNAIDGRSLPRMAVSNTSFLVHVLGITNPVHRQKIQLKVTDRERQGSENERLPMFRCFIEVAEISERAI